MKNTELATAIKNLRSRHGITQEELAEKSQLSLRTVQRIECGENEPRGDTLKRLATVFDIPADELIDSVEHADNNFLVILNLSALCSFAFPLLGVIGTVVLWILKRDKIKHVNETGKKIINFQLTWSLAVVAILLFFTITKINHYNPLSFITEHAGFARTEILLLSLYVYSLALIAVNTVRLSIKRKVIYQPAIPFLK